MLQEVNGQSDFATFFLLQFTKQLIKNSDKIEINISEVEEPTFEKPDVKKIVRETIKQESLTEREPLSSSALKTGLDFSNRQLLNRKKPQIFRVQQQPIRRAPPIHVLKIPEPRLPPTLQYLKPTPTAGKEIDLAKLNPLLQDPAVKEIQCDGKDQNIVVRGTMGVKKTSIILSKEEIDSVLNKFSESAKIPLQEGIFRVVVGKLILSAIVSGVISSRFIIKKMMYHPGFPQGQGFIQR
ncbi:MAG: hypothetical protein ABIJ14_02180 [Nanoarchaeota archaeon]|nr:hypothetical protein [Nanoarchaeota archaeon]